MRGLCFFPNWIVFWENTWRYIYTIYVNSRATVYKKAILYTCYHFNLKVEHISLSCYIVKKLIFKHCQHRIIFGHLKTVTMWMCYICIMHVSHIAWHCIFMSSWVFYSVAHFVVITLQFKALECGLQFMQMLFDNMLWQPG